MSRTPRVLVARLLVEVAAGASVATLCACAGIVGPSVLLAVPFLVGFLVAALAICLVSVGRKRDEP